MTQDRARSDKIGVLVESHFDETEYRRFNEFFPTHGYTVEYLSHLWGRPELTFTGNDSTEHVTVTIEVNDVNPVDYAGLIMIGGYAMDRLRYEEHPRPGQPNEAPAVAFLRKAMATDGLTIGAICHGLWLLCAAPELMKGRRVTAAHNILGDVLNAGGIYVYDGDRGVDTCVDGHLVTGRHPGIIEEFLEVYLRELARA